MATWYVNSAAVGTGVGTSWVNATTTLAAAITLSAAGDDFNVKNTHSETTAGAVTLTFKGTAASPNRVFSCDATNTPAQASDLLAGASIADSTGTDITINGFVYIYGVNFKAGSGAVSSNINLGASGGHEIALDTCTLQLLGTSQASVNVFGAQSTASARVRLINTPITFNGTATSGISFNAGCFTWQNTASAVVGSASLNVLFGSVAIDGTERETIVICDGVDLSGVASGKKLVDPGNLTQIQLKNCKLTSGVLVGVPLGPGCSYDMCGCGSGNTPYDFQRSQYQGALTTSTTVFNNATDGVTPVSWQIITTTNAKRQSPFECFEIVKWVTLGTYAASLIQLTSATAALTNADVWVDVEYLSSASFPLAATVTTAPAAQLTAGSALSAGSWATGGLGNNYQLAIPSFVQAVAGLVRFTVKVAKASLTVNIDPDVVVA